MKLRLRNCLFILSMVLMMATSVCGGNTKIKPVDPKASLEAQALLELLYTLSGDYTLSGQHNYPNTGDMNSQFAAQYIGKTPVVWSTDWGFAEDGDTDSYLARPGIVKEAIRQHQKGSLITVCWHAVPPTTDEPTTFRPLPGADPDSLASVQGQLTDRQFKDMLTPGTLLYSRWCSQVDSIAFYLKELQDAKVPVLWRPYHEMNGNWFWWGGRTGVYSTKRLYQQLFNRLVNVHKLHNLIWLWSVDRPNQSERYFSQYNPGSEFFDVVSLDVYGRDFSQDYYDSLLVLAEGKPLVLGEVGNPPSPEIIENQPGWVFYVTWAGMVRNTSRKEYMMLLNSQSILNREDPAYWELTVPYRSACDLPLLPLIENEKTGFSGNWLFRDDRSKLDHWGAGRIPYKMNVEQGDNRLIIKKTIIPEYKENEVIIDTIYLDGSEMRSEFRNSPMITTADFSEKRDSICFTSRITFGRGDRISEMIINETWCLKDNGQILSVEQSSSSMWGDRNITMIYEKLLAD
ncbi:MAG: hypothetical protein JXB24_11505 [Bacteroidales bacterium]|nr:hypothetical protein [Bacteroidales bacterium]